MFRNLLKACLVSFYYCYLISPTWAEELDKFVPVQDITVNQWQQKALKDIAKRYDCLEYNVPRNRRQFALLLHNCLQTIESLESKDVQTIERLQKDFTSELLGLETRVTELEDKQFTVTTKLTGEIIYQISDSFSREDQSQLFSGYRARINFNTSFTGKDLLRVRLEAIDIGRLDRVTDTALTRLGTDGTSEGNFDIKVAYEFPWGDRAEVIVSPEGISLNDVADVLNPFASSSRGAVSRFARRDPATLRTPDGSGVGLKYELKDNLYLNLAYVVESGDVANPELGVFGSSYSTIIQLVLNPDDNVALALSYTHAYESDDRVNLMESTGSETANRPFGEKATSSDRLGLQLNWEVTGNFELGGWVGVAQAYQKNGGNDQATILNGAFTIAFNDLWGENNLGGIIIGVPPLVTNHSDGDLIAPMTTLHLEILYRIQVRDHLEITPGLFVLINPDTPESNTIWVGTVRTRFHF
ncbi:iron uptake porin [Gloeocapsa sp. PCC 73106]|uniref:iron uptake porin n=1 Tax=Gloeocapsa sp. PCC 73106 TaxID=102232 RepID=UPI0002AC7669|nr:iron uptake porin [Gloeocapsa sp. PCC 73106]ELR99917.1 Carbohydrate-selective porin, OprB family [Gloeocapsa sp. PCC 73106]